MSRNRNSIRATVSKIGAIAVFGAAVGMVVGAALSNVTPGLAAGAVLGIAIGVLLEFLSRRKSS